MAETRTPPHRPDRVSNPPLPPIPTPDESHAEVASTTFSRYRTGLSHHRTELSEHRTDLSEYRTDLSGNRTELSMRRTGMSIHRTRMSADRTLMSEIRTALSLIGFGFTVYQAFRKAFEAGLIANAQSARLFGLALLLIGIVLLVGGIVRHVQFAAELRARRREMIDEGLIHGQSTYPISVTFVSALALLLVGIAAVVNAMWGGDFLGP